MAVAVFGSAALFGGLGIADAVVTPPHAVIAPSPLSFGSIAEDNTITKTIVVRNSGTLPLAVSGGNVSDPAEFSADLSSCLAGSLAYGKTCNIPISFTPTSNGVHSATLTINDNTTANPEHVTLNGTGIASMVITPASVAIGNTAFGSTVTKTITITNKNKHSVSVVSVLGGPNAADFTQNFNYNTVVGLSALPSASDFFNPAGIAVDSANHRLFVSDFNNNRVLVYNLDHNNHISSTSAAYVLGQSDFTSSGGGATQDGLFEPYGLAYDAISSRLFVADLNDHRVIVFNVATSTIFNGENADYVLGQSDFTSYVATTTQNGLYLPSGLAYDESSSRLFVADGSNNNRVLVFNVATSTISNGENADYVLGQSDFTSDVAATTQNGLNGPGGLSYDATFNRLFVTDNNNNRVLVFNVATSTISNGENADYVLGQSDFTSSSGATTQNGFSTPGGLAYDLSANRLFVADVNNNRVLVFNVATSTLSNGENADYVLGQSNFTSNGGTGTQKTFYDPVALAYDVSSGNLFLADKNGNRLLSFPASTGTIANDENANGGLGYYGCTGSSLIFNQSCKDAVSFTPGVLGSESANLVFTVSPDSSSPYTIPFTVSGTTSPAKVSPLSLAFGTVKHPATKSKTVTVTNLANGPIALSEEHKRIF